MSVKSLLFSGLTLLFLLAQGQDKSIDSLVLKKEKHQYIKLSPFHLYNYYPTVQISYEYQWNYKIGLQTEVGYVLPYSIFNAYPYGQKGVKLQTEFRYYFAGTPKKQQHYVSFEIYANQASFKRETFETECFDLECLQQYRKRYYYKIRYWEQGFTPKYGLIWYWNRFLLDLNWGLRFRRVHYEKPSFGEDNWFWFDPKAGTRLSILPVIGFRAGWRLR